VTHRPAAYHPPILRRSLLVPLLAAAALALAACGEAKSTLPPSPGAGDAVTLHNLARYPEVYADARVATTGTVERAGSLYLLAGAPGARIVLEPTAAAAPYAGRRVRVSGLFVVTFKLGYEILLGRISAAGSL